METALRMTASYPRIPYGEMSFRRIRVNGWLYVDKTRYLRPLEDERHVFFIRPRPPGASASPAGAAPEGLNEGMIGPPHMADEGPASIPEVVRLALHEIHLVPAGAGKEHDAVA